MPTNHTLRIHVEYQVLYLAELRAILRDFERAYNLLENIETRPWGRIRRADRLTVRTIETGNSVDLILWGGAGLLALAKVVKDVASTRETLWKSEETKWKAKTAKLEYEELKARTIRRSNRKDESSTAQALEIVNNRVEIIERTKHINALQVEVDEKATKLLERPSRKMLPDKREE